MIDLDELEALARAATPGPWAHEEIAYLWLGDERNQSFIAAVTNPTVVLGLIAEVRKVRAERDWLAGTLEKMNAKHPVSFTKAEWVGIANVYVEENNDH